MAEGDLGSFDAWYDDPTRRGILEAHVGLHPSHTATTVRLRDGDVLLTDGPFAEGREQVGELALINCRDLDEAVEIAAGHPATSVGHYRTALNHTTNDAERRYLTRRLTELEADASSLLSEPGSRH